MLIALHKNATTTPAVRAAIQQSSASDYELARQYGVRRETIRRWRKRDSVFDASHTPHRLQTALNAAQEELVVMLRTQLQLSLDDLLAVVREFIEPSGVQFRVCDSSAVGGDTWRPGTARDGAAAPHAHPGGETMAQFASSSVLKTG